MTRRFGGTKTGEGTRRVGQSNHFHWTTFLQTNREMSAQRHGKSSRSATQRGKRRKYGTSRMDLRTTILIDSNTDPDSTGGHQKEFETKPCPEISSATDEKIRNGGKSF